MKSNQNVQPRRWTASCNAAAADEVSYTQLHQMYLFAALGSPVSAGIQPTHQNGGRMIRKMAFSAEEMRHHFAIENLEKPGAFRPQPYLYTCVRCKWIFRINDSRGSIVALDGLGRPVPEPENSKRIVTFQKGPCPAFPVFEYLAFERQRERRLSGYLSRFVEAIRDLLGGRREPAIGGRQTQVSARPFRSVTPR
jgi:hypothetical protein